MNDQNNLLYKCLIIIFEDLSDEKLSSIFIASAIETIRRDGIAMTIDMIIEYYEYSFNYENKTPSTEGLSKDLMQQNLDQLKNLRLLNDQIESEEAQS